jgi:ribose transport system substrate-binding protein
MNIPKTCQKAVIFDGCVLNENLSGSRVKPLVSKDTGILEGENQEMKSKSLWTTLTIILAIGLLFTACQPSAPQATATPAASKPTATHAATKAAKAPKATAPAAPAGSGQNAVPTPAFFSMNDLTQQLKWVEAKPSGDPNYPWLQVVNSDGEQVDTSQWEKEDGTVCFSNASTANSWRVTGRAAMLFEVERQKAAGAFANFIETNALGKSDKQVADIEALMNKGCDVFIVSPAAPDQLAPVLEKLAASGKPVVVFERGVNAKNITSFIHPIGSYAFGYEGAVWLANTMGGKGNVLALRVLPGVEVLENRWSAASLVFSKYPDIKVVGVEFDESDPSKAKAIVLDYLKRNNGKIDGIWSDIGALSGSIYDAFIEYGAMVPPMTGEDYNGFLKTWDSKKLKAIAPSNPVFQWRTAVVAAAKILKGQPVPKEWVLPQPSINQDNLKDYVFQDLPDSLYSSSGLTHGVLLSIFPK